MFACNLKSLSKNLRTMDWLEILTETSECIKTAVAPLVSTSVGRRTYGTGAGGDPKKHIDLQAENTLVRELTERNLSFKLISEESGFKNYGSKPTYYVTVDPIDGTTNTLRGIPFGCTSIAVSKYPRLDAVEAAVVADLFREATYVAEKSLGAFRNNREIEPAQTTSLKEAVIGVDLNAYKASELSAKLNRLLTQTSHIRHLGANALELCFVADGTIDAFVDIRGRLRTTDIAAAALIIKEAGAVITTPERTPMMNRLSPAEKVSFIASGNSGLHQVLLETLERA